MSYDWIALTMFASMMVMLITGQRVFAAIGSVAVVAGLALWGTGGGELAFSAAMKLMKWYPLLTLPMFIFMGYVLSESRMADDLYKMFHVWMGPLPGGLAVGTIGLMVLISAMNGLSVAGMAIGATIALPELLRRNYDTRMVTGVIQAGSSLGILVPPSVVLVLYAMIARQPVGQLWLAGVLPGLMMAGLFVLYIVARCWFQPHLGPALLPEERDVPMREKLRLLGAGLLPLGIFLIMMVPFINGATSLVESSAVGALAALLAAVFRVYLTPRNILLGVVAGVLVWYVYSRGIVVNVAFDLAGHTLSLKALILAALAILLMLATIVRIRRSEFLGHVFESSVRNTLGISCMFMWIILAALTFGAVFDGLGAVKAIEGLFVDRLGLGPWEILILMQLSYLLMGTFLDDTAMLVIVAPLYIPLVAALGFDLIWYGVLYTITCQIAYMTPPFGYNLFLMRAMAPPEITLIDIYRSIVPFVGVMLVALALVTAFPGIALWLPEQVYGR